MQDNRSKSIWISLADRPPPAKETSPRLLLRFRDRQTHVIEMGYYLGDGELRILGKKASHQLPLSLADIDQWQAVDPEQLERIESYV